MIDRMEIIFEAFALAVFSENDEEILEYLRQEVVLDPEAEAARLRTMLLDTLKEFLLTISTEEKKRRMSLAPKKEKP